ncbi:hypothetical protein Q31a_05680 [Aureliella helgolandensis]|uniref:DUF1501 domain-containing protein n=2 Tax=Aureliella helgolandensis TaxID=2527968 RepID=A0A518G178_9BACT|nr:hypothetical protein Q31a_05680 [Aureliella helgolandensis]
MTRFAEQLSRAAEGAAQTRPKSLMMIWLQGGASQLETFDPHPGTKYGGETRGITTSIPNVQIADTLPATAEQLHHATLLRSIVSQEGDHERATYHLKTGWRPDPTLVHPAIGSVVCYQSANNLEIPRHISIVPGEWPARGGYLGPSFDAFQIGDVAAPIPNLTPRVSEESLTQRLDVLLGTLEDEFQRGRLANLNRQRTLHQTATENAVRMMSSDQLTAFDVQQESASTVDKFGDNAFGRGCLAGIRLLSAGVRCVEVELGGWDTHINNHELQSSKARVLDAALAATLSELHARDMLNDTIVFCGGEFGRTPQINPAGGRDHWPHGFSAVLAGGNFRRGYVHGATAANPESDIINRKGNATVDPQKITENIVPVPDLHATLLRALGIDHEFEMQTPVGRPLRWSDGQVVTDLLQS